MEHFIYLLEFRVIICKKCQYAVLPSHIDTHFTAKPHQCKREERQRIAEEVVEINGLIGNEETLRSECAFPPAISTPIAALAKPKENGLPC